MSQSTLELLQVQAQWQSDDKNCSSGEIDNTYYE